MTEWWRGAVIYQVYPRSFQDSNADGIGDLPGVLKRLDYLAWLGVDALWLSPVYPSPMADFGYDVSDYTGIDPIFGTLKDFDQVVAKAHALGLKMIIDFVPNHTSDQHQWFRESRAARANAKRDWYVWRDGKNGGAPNNWLSEFGGSAWTFDPATSQYFYHAYLSAQPDLNWRNPEVRAAMHAAMKFWLDRGVDGFRLDTIEHLIEDIDLRDNPPNEHWTPADPPTQKLRRQFTTDQPEISEALQGLRAVTDEYEHRVLIGETYLPLERVVTYYGRGIHLPFNFHLIGAAWRAEALAALIRRYEGLLPPDAWPNWVLGNHDRARIASRVGAGQARIAAMLLLTLRGTPTMYYGDELGLSDVPIPTESVQDPWEKNVPGHGLGRDPVRTPMPWNVSTNAGFSDAMPWLPLNGDHDTRNVARQRDDESSILSLYRALLDLRRAASALSSGDYGLIAHQGDVLMYERISGSEIYLVALNMSGDETTVSLPRAGRVVLSTQLDRVEQFQVRLLTLRPDEGVVLKLSA
jgi:alpha-glucosidase